MPNQTINVLVTEMSDEYSVVAIGAETKEEAQKEWEEMGSGERIVAFFQFNSDEEGFDIVRAIAHNDATAPILEALFTRVFEAGRAEMRSQLRNLINP